MKTISDDQLLAHLGSISEGGRYVVGIAGPPGSGKSTMAEKMESRLNANMSGYAAIFPMDGFHYDDQVLILLGLRPRKGAPETFDVEGFVHMLERLRSNTADEVAVPIFDRSLEIARAAARIIPQSVRLVIVEGNYLLLDRGHWNNLSFDTTVMLNVPRETLRQRLVDRWVQHGKSAEEIASQVNSNDMINVDVVQKCSRIPDFFVDGL